MSGFWYEIAGFPSCEKVSGRSYFKAYMRLYNSQMIRYIKENKPMTEENKKTISELEQENKEYSESKNFLDAALPSDIKEKAKFYILSGHNHP